MIRLACPDCGSTNLAMLVEVPATLNGTFTRDSDGDVDFTPETDRLRIDHPQDMTEVGWHCNRCHNESSDPWYEELVPVEDHVWPDPVSDGWIDAWNGWYATEAEARRDTADAARRGDPRRLPYGSGLRSEEDQP